MTRDQIIWKAQLVARLHDPPEKALILMRTAEGHEGGTARLLKELLFPEGFDRAIGAAVEQADRWASAADRAAFPRHEDDGRFPAWQNVRFHERPVIIHPLTGDQCDLANLSSIEPDHAKQVAADHLGRLVIRNADGTPDYRRSALAMWRFGPDIRDSSIGKLWALLPADTRVPDHTIWDHLDLTAALATAFAADPEGGPALLAVSLGPVQDFIAASRSVSDLWAGSHLLSRLSWEAMRVICEELGPGAILFPRIRGIPQVDVWLRGDCELDASLFSGQEWASTSTTDANPLFAAALPNRFTALVPASRARVLAERITTRVQQWAVDQTTAAFRLLLEKANLPDDAGYPGYDQIHAQLRGFPEVHWAVVPWSLVGKDDKGLVDASDSSLADAMTPFFQTNPPGYLNDPGWKLLSGQLELESGWFWRPNPGALYPALHELLERVLAATKSIRPFEQSEQTGWRCALTGETEWITTNRTQLGISYRQQEDTLWAKVASVQPSWVKPGEHLGALPMLKRLWPVLFSRELGSVLGKDVQRFVVSSHTMAITGSLVKHLESGHSLPTDLSDDIVGSRPERVALPRRLHHAIRPHGDAEALVGLPGWLESFADKDDTAGLEAARKRVSRALDARLETYFGLMLMDGDRMGAWISASPDLSGPNRQVFHPQIQAGLARFAGDSNLRKYVEQLRSASPSRHMAISDALNSFAVRLVPAVIEEQHHGKLIYAGGDDVLAMLPAGELLEAAAACRAAYSGEEGDRYGAAADGFRAQGDGYVLHRDRLMRLMGKGATASCGLVIAHHQAPLGAVLRELRAAEKRAKGDGGRNAWSLSLVKRSGGTVQITAKWGLPVAALRKLRGFLADADVSRRAVYNSLEWMDDVPPRDKDLLATLLGYQFQRQTGSATTAKYHDVTGLARELVDVAFNPELTPASARAAPIQWLRDFMVAAEFLARNTRATPAAPQSNRQEVKA